MKCYNLELIKFACSECKDRDNCDLWKVIKDKISDMEVQTNLDDRGTLE